MLRFTLDTNCLIDLEEKRGAAAYVRALADAHAEKRADVALVAVSASERQPGDVYLSSYRDFQSRVEKLSLAHLRIVLPMLYFDVGYWDIGLYADNEMIKLEQSIHQILFPSIPFEWSVYALNAGVPLDAVKAAEARRWRNAFCDRQMIWSHIHNGRDIFVTRDANFRTRFSRSVDFSAVRILTPKEAVALL